MSSHSRNSNESEGASIKSLVKKIAQDVQALSYRQLQHEAQLKERDAQFALMQDELKMVKERDEYTKSKKFRMHLALGAMSHMENKVLKSINTTNHPLEELEKKGKKALERLG